MKSAASAAAAGIIIAMLTACVIRLQPNEVGRIVAITSLPIALAAIALILSRIDRGET